MFAYSAKINNIWDHSFIGNRYQSWINFNYNFKTDFGMPWRVFFKKENISIFNNSPNKYSDFFIKSRLQFLKGDINWRGINWRFGANGKNDIIPIFISWKSGGHIYGDPTTRSTIQGWGNTSVFPSDVYFKISKFIFPLTEFPDATTYRAINISPELFSGSIIRSDNELLSRYPQTAVIYNESDSDSNEHAIKNRKQNIGQFRRIIVAFGLMLAGGGLQFAGYIMVERGRKCYGYGLIIVGIVFGFLGPISIWF